MNIGVTFINGVRLGIEFPGDGLHCILSLLIFDIIFMSDEMVNEFKKD